MTQWLVDEDFYRAALGLFIRHEQAEESFDLKTAMRDFIESPYVRDRFEEEIGRPLKDERIMMRVFVGAIYIPDRENMFEDYPNDMEGLEDRVAEFVRASMWSFVCAWTQRYGGLQQHLRRGYTLVDPTADDPQKPS
jgi:hypothetical protein